jgi:hypothetical protein
MGAAETTPEARESWPLPLDDHPNLELESDFAQLAIVPTAAEEEPFLEAVDGRGGVAHVDIRADRGTTRVRIGGAFESHDEPWRKERWWIPGSWDTRWWWKSKVRERMLSRVRRFVVHVPPSVRARVRLAAGRVHVERLAGCDLVIEADAGELTLEDVAGRMRLSTDAGRIDGQSLAGTFDIATSAGAVRLDIAGLDAGRHRVRSTMGMARIELARGLPVDIRTRTTMGSARIEFPSTRAAAAILEVEADLGAIRIMPSERTYIAPTPDAAARTTPYRTADGDAATEPDVQSILERVASGTLTPSQARELLRELGWS